MYLGKAHPILFVFKQVLKKLRYEVFFNKLKLKNVMKINGVKLKNYQII